MGRVVEPVSFEDQCRLWRDSINHARSPDGTIEVKDQARQPPCVGVRPAHVDVVGSLS